MKVTATITEKELHYFYIYGKTLRECPCSKCGDSAGCCGCHEFDTWRKSLDTLPISANDWNLLKDVKEYTIASLDIADIETQINELLKKQQDLRDKASELLTKFEVIDE